jgi:hypothetical protein
MKLSIGNPLVYTCDVHKQFRKYISDVRHYYARVRCNKENKSREKQQPKHAISITTTNKAYRIQLRPFIGLHNNSCSLF